MQNFLVILALVRVLQCYSSCFVESFTLYHPSSPTSRSWQPTATKLRDAVTTASTTDAETAKELTYKAPSHEIDRRRNLAIISHPDSGKTTMTEKLLLYGGALQQAGAVRQKAEQRATQSDFMEMEKERGISISSTVMNFDYSGYRLNILDTPYVVLSFFV